MRFQGLWLRVWLLRVYVEGFRFPAPGLIFFGFGVMVEGSGLRLFTDGDPCNV